ncbi:MAG: ATP-binding protein [Rhodothermales bacterium]
MESFPHLEPELLIANYALDATSYYRNEAWEQTVGSDWSRMSGEDRARAVQFLKEAADGSLVTNQFFMLKMPDAADPVPVLLNFLPAHVKPEDPSEDGPPAIGAVTVTGEVLREPATWTQSQTQRNRLETLGRMTMGIAHDFNNLLSGILGYTELLKNYAKEELADKTLIEHLDTVEQAALDGAALIRKIQQYIRQERQEHFAPLDIPTLIQDCIALTRPYWYNEPRRQGIAIEVEQEYEDVPPVMGSATELREVFLNLILNAVQAMPNGGRLVFRTDESRKGVRIRIKDTGMGMSDSVRERIFEPLFTTKGERGTGMGMAVSYGIIQEHEGTINVKSHLGEGTLFEIILPQAEGSGQEHISDPEERPSETARILIVDDEEMVRNILVKLLSLKGHDVVSVGSASEALATLDGEVFDIVFTDLGMPEMNGRQLAHAIRQQFSDLPIVLLTGDTETGEPGEDVDVVLSKPFKVAQLQNTIQQLLPH